MESRMINEASNDLISSFINMLIGIAKKRNDIEAIIVLTYHEYATPDLEIETENVEINLVTINELTEKVLISRLREIISVIFELTGINIKLTTIKRNDLNIPWMSEKEVTSLKKLYNGLILYDPSGVYSSLKTTILISLGGDDDLKMHNLFNYEPPLNLVRNIN